MEIDKVIHEPARLRIMMILSGVEKTDFNFLLTALSLTRGNLSRHVEKLEAAGYIKVEKIFKDKIPNTSYQIIPKGSKALTKYWENLDSVRELGKS